MVIFASVPYDRGVPSEFPAKRIFFLCTVVHAHGPSAIIRA